MVEGRLLPRRAVSLKQNWGVRLGLLDGCDIFGACTGLCNASAGCSSSGLALRSLCFAQRKLDTIRMIAFRKGQSSFARIVGVREKVGYLVEKSQVSSMT